MMSAEAGMRLNADFAQRVVIDTRTMAWTASPSAGVERKMLDRIGGEEARATSIVRYAPGSAFATHDHQRGEEFLVLDGVFSDEHGDYPAGTYVRNPDGSRHAPFSKPGCTILVKLRQFAESDTRQAVVDTSNGPWKSRGLPGLSAMTLHEHGSETVRLVRFEPGARITDDPHPGGEEVLVLEGVLQDEYGRYPAGTWLRQPDGSRHAPFSDEGCVLWVKRGHLPPRDGR